MYGQLLDKADGSEKENGVDRGDWIEWADKVDKVAQLDVSDD